MAFVWLERPDLRRSPDAVHAEGETEGDRETGRPAVAVTWGTICKIAEVWSKNGFGEM